MFASVVEAGGWDGGVGTWAVVVVVRISAPAAFPVGGFGVGVGFEIGVWLFCFSFYWSFHVTF